MNKNVVFIIFGVIAFLLGAVAIFFALRTQDGGYNTGPIACTADAMMCPDGSYVGRTGPDCEFVCPN